MSFDPIRVLRTLNEHQVRFVVIGGMAATLLGSPSVTNDLDICYERTPVNMERLATALSALHARLRGAPENVPFLLDARTIAMGDHFTFETDAGPLDCLGTPSGSNGFPSLDTNASDKDLDGLSVRVVSINDLIRMKRASGRSKDKIHLEILEGLREELGE